MFHDGHSQNHSIIYNLTGVHHPTFQHSQSVNHIKESMKYLSPAFIALALITTLLTHSSFENAASAQLVSKIISIFTAPFHSAPDLSPTMSATPFYLIDKNPTYILIGFAVILSFLAGMIEVFRLIKLGRNKQSAGVLASIICLIFFNVTLLVWNALI
jgi:hypothetical protein